MDRFPTVTFVVPARDAQALEGCLTSIHRQHYPEDAVEVVVVDERSDAEVLAAARRRFAVVVRPGPRGPGDGLGEAVRAGSNELAAVLPRQGGLPHTDWLRAMVRPFVEDEAVAAACTRFVQAPGDSSLTRYAAHLHADPPAWLAFGDAANPRFLDHACQEARSGEGYTSLRFATEASPYLPLNRGLVFRRSLWSEGPGPGRTLVTRIVADGLRIAYVPGAGLYHPPLGDMDACVRFYGDLMEGAAGEAAASLAGGRPWRRTRRALFGAYGVTLAGPFVDGCGLAIGARDRAMLWHAPVCMALSWQRLGDWIRGAGAGT